MKTILLTGATDGIGLATAKSLVSKGHHLLIHGRSEEKLSHTLQLLKDLNSSAKVQSYQADLSHFDEVARLIAEIKRDHKIVDIIINNAGVFKTSTPIAPNGLDVRFVVNTLSPYLITKELQALLADDGRVVNLSSAAQAPVNLKALTGEIRLNDDFQAYAQSKLAITIWSQELSKTMGAKQVMVAVNPGSLLASKMVKEGFGLAGNDISIGSDILVRAALSDEFSNANGKYFDNDAKQFSLPHHDAQNPEICAQVMAQIEKITQR